MELARFRVWPADRRGLYFTVVVSGTKNEMLRRCREEEARVTPQTQAACLTWTKYHCEGGRTVASHEAGELHFYHRRLLLRYIAHEAAHAMFAWGRRKGVSRDDWSMDDGVMSEAEEDMCYSLGELVAQIVAGMNAAGLTVTEE